jgi:glutathione S-transferase
MTKSNEPIERFILRTTLTSPFGRKVRLAADVLGLADRVTVQTADVSKESDTLRCQNPLGKIPCLVREDGSGMYDSAVIVEFLQHVAGTEQLLPLGGPERFARLTLASLADGIMEAGGLVIYESRWHEPEKVSQPWIDYQRGKMSRALAAFEAAPPDPKRSDLVAVVLACALEFLDRRPTVDWRASCPRLVDWLAAFARHEPAYERVMSAT